MTNDSTNKEPSFEELINEIESLVGKIERGELSLSEVIDTHKIALKKAINCKKILTQKEQEIINLSEETKNLLANNNNKEQ